MNAVASNACEIKRENIMRKVTIFVLMSAALLVSACNTVKGLGRDIESVGQAGDRAT